MRVALRERLPFGLTPLGVWRAARLRRHLRSTAAHRLLRAFAAAYPEATFVEVGANDGRQHDHLRPYVLAGRWTGVMVEPVPYVFERLRRNYGDVGRVALENAAVADRDGELPFYHLAEAPPDERARLPEWYDGIGSFSREAVLSHAVEIPDVERRLVVTQVPALTLETLLAKHGLDRLDLLLIDVEGYDADLLASVDLRARHPRLLVYEHFHLAPGARAATRERVRAAGYETLEEGFDTFCLDTGPDDTLTRTWRALRPAVPALSAADKAR